LATLDHEEQLLLRTREDSAEVREDAAGPPGMWSDRARALVRSAIRHRLDAELAWLRLVRDAIDDALADAPPSRQ
jgi:hypothetical protein